MSVFGIYQHHERTLQANLEADLIARESGFAQDTKAFVFFSAASVAYHFFAKESDAPVYDNSVLFSSGLTSNDDIIINLGKALYVKGSEGDPVFDISEAGLVLYALATSAIFNPDTVFNGTITANGTTTLNEVLTTYADIIITNGASLYIKSSEGDDVFSVIDGITKMLGTLNQIGPDGGAVPTDVANNGHFIRSNIPGNVLQLQQMDTAGYSAIRVIANSAAEKGAWGYGNTGSGDIFAGCIYNETFSNTTSNFTPYEAVGTISGLGSAIWAFFANTGDVSIYARDPVALGYGAGIDLRNYAGGGSIWLAADGNSFISIRHPTYGAGINLHLYAGTLASGNGFKIWTGGVFASQTLKFEVADDGSIFHGPLTANAPFTVLGTGYAPNTGITLNGSAACNVYFSNNVADSTSRNWQVINNFAAYGDLVFRVSGSVGGDPSAGGGVTSFSLVRDGTVVIGHTNKWYSYDDTGRSSFTNTSGGSGYGIAADSSHVYLIANNSVAFTINSSGDAEFAGTVTLSSTFTTTGVINTSNDITMSGGELTLAKDATSASGVATIITGNWTGTKAIKSYEQVLQSGVRVQVLCVDSDAP